MHSLYSFFIWQVNFPGILLMRMFFKVTVELILVQHFSAVIMTLIFCYRFAISIVVRLNWQATADSQA